LCCLFTWSQLRILAVAKSNPERKTRSHKFPLTLHPAGQYCKKIKGKLYCLSSDKKRALYCYLGQAAYLHSGKLPKPKSANDGLPLKTLCNLHLFKKRKLFVDDSSRK